MRLLPVKLLPVKLIVCGLPGTGKSTTCRLLSQVLGLELLETDRELVNNYALLTGEQLTCREIYRKIGEPEFRNFERRILLSCAPGKQIIDLGGGILTHPENAKVIQSLGVVFYLKNDRDAVYGQLMTKGLPAYLNPQEPYESFLKLAAEREPLYEKYAHVTIDCTGLSPQEIVDEITTTRH